MNTMEAMMAETAAKELTVQALETTARVCHEANSAYCVSIGETRVLGWDDLPLPIRLELMEAVRKAATHDWTPEQAHEEWRQTKIAEGWSLGPTRNPTAREHPCLVPFDELPPEQKAKDRLFLAVVKALREEG